MNDEIRKKTHDHRRNDVSCIISWRGKIFIGLPVLYNFKNFYEYIEDIVLLMYLRLQTELHHVNVDVNNTFILNFLKFLAPPRSSSTYFVLLPIVGCPHLLRSPVSEALTKISISCHPTFPFLTPFQLTSLQSLVSQFVEFPPWLRFPHTCGGTQTTRFYQLPHWYHFRIATFIQRMSSSSSLTGASSAQYEHSEISNASDEMSRAKQVSRLDELRREARKRAEIKHAATKASRPTRVYSKPSELMQPKKPKRMLTKRELSSKRSAEICRIKAQIYTELLEKSIVEEERKQKEIQIELKKAEEQASILKTQIKAHEHLGFSNDDDYQTYVCAQDGPIPSPSQSLGSNFGGLLSGTFLAEAMVQDSLPSFFKTAQLEECGFLSTLSGTEACETDACADLSIHGNIDIDVNVGSIPESFSPNTIVCTPDLPFMTPLKQVSSIRSIYKNDFSSAYL